jgi:tetratricopeptide (TPR) repeat protein
MEIRRLVYVERAQRHALVSRYADAVADLTAALELDPTAPVLYVLRGQMYLYLYEWDAVLTDYNAALELDPGYADAYFYRGVLYASILQTGIDLRDEALSDFQQYLDLAPNGDHAAESAAYIDTLQSAQDAID